MRGIIYCFLCLLVISSAIAVDDELYDYEELTLNLHLANTVDIVPRASNWRVESLEANLTWFPHESFRQKVLEVLTHPTASVRPDGYHYVWDHPTTTSLDLRLDATIRTTNDPLPVKDSIKFPIQTLSSDIARYIQEGELIDFNEAIRDQALSLAGQQDDLFSVVYSIADWVTTNIEYNLTTITADATQPSSWVMEHREGVCDEMTALFISMVRSLGIPARFVSGISYTNLPEFPEPWGGHGWAEVWFPDVGWVPFDVTYGTYGFIDATHIKLQDSFDAQSNSVEFTMTSRQASLLTRTLDVDVDVVDKRHKVQELFTVQLENAGDISLNSYNLITATITNQKNHYVSARFQLARTENVDIVGSNIQNVLLRPYETRKLRFLVKVHDLREGFYYTFPIKLYVGLREVATTEFESRQGKATYNEQFFSEYFVTNEEKEYNTHTVLECESNPGVAYIDEIVTIDCALTNKDNAILQGIQACLGTCERIDLAPHESATFSRNVVCDSAGINSLLATTKNRLIDKFALIRFECLDETAIEIASLTYPDSLEYDKIGEISFSLEKKSEAVPKEVVISIEHDNFKQVWTSDELIQKQQFSFTLAGKNLDLKDNKVVVSVHYQDSLGKEQEVSKEFIIEANEFSFGQKFMVRMLNVQRWIEGLF